MKKATLLTTTALLILAGLTYAVIVLLPMANEKVTGVVTDAKTGEPIIGATVVAYIDKENKGAVATDLDGNFALALPAGTYTIEVKALGYMPQRISGVIVADDKITVLDTKLNEESKMLDSVVITSDDKTSGSIKAVTTGGVPAMYGDVTTSHTDAAPTYSGEADMEAPSGFSYSKSSSSAVSTVDVVKPSIVESKSSGVKTKAADKSSVKGKSERFEPAKGADTKGTKEVAKEPDTRAGQLTAGEWSDNRNWDFFIGLRKKKEWENMESLWGFNFTKRYTVKVVSGGKPQNDVPVVLKDKKGTVLFEGRTDINGYCYLFAGLVDKGEEGATVEVKTDGGTKSVSAGEAGNERPVTIEITRRKSPAAKVDIMFTIDATGSMGDEMNYLKEELSDVIRRVKAGSEQMMDIRVSANVYRDHGDEYVVRPFPFTTNISKVLTDLSAQHAGGGGDFEEAVEEGLDDAINKHEWSEDATARILFLVLDAPPHNNAVYKIKIQKAVITAAKKGIRIVPITSSGINKETEFLMRYISAATGGTYVFLTDHSGIGGSHIEPTIGKYDVEYLNNLMVRLIQAYLTTES